MAFAVSQSLSAAGRAAGRPRAASRRGAVKVFATSRVDKCKKTDIIVSPSLLSCDFGKLGEEVSVARGSREAPKTPAASLAKLSLTFALFALLAPALPLRRSAPSTRCAQLARSHPSAWRWAQGLRAAERRQPSLSLAGSRLPRHTLARPARALRGATRAGVLDRASIASSRARAHALDHPQAGCDWVHVDVMGALFACARLPACCFARCCPGRAFVRPAHAPAVLDAPHHAPLPPPPIAAVAQRALDTHVPRTPNTHAPTNRRPLCAQHHDRPAHRRRAAPAHRQGRRRAPGESFSSV